MAASCPRGLDASGDKRLNSDVADGAAKTRVGCRGSNFYRTGNPSTMPLSNRETKRNLSLMEESNLARQLQRNVDDPQLSSL